MDAATLFWIDFMSSVVMSIPIEGGAPTTLASLSAAVIFLISNIAACGCARVDWKSDVDAGVGGQSAQIGDTTLSTGGAESAGGVATTGGTTQAIGGMTQGIGGIGATDGGMGLGGLMGGIGGQTGGAPSTGGNTGTAGSTQIPACSNPAEFAVKAIATNGYHTCALTAAGGVRCWGRYYYGQLGEDTETDRKSPPDERCFD